MNQHILSFSWCCDDTASCQSEHDGLGEVWPAIVIVISSIYNPSDFYRTLPYPHRIELKIKERKITSTEYQINKTDVNTNSEREIERERCFPSTESKSINDIKRRTDFQAKIHSFNFSVVIVVSFRFVLFSLLCLLAPVCICCVVVAVSSVVSLLLLFGRTKIFEHGKQIQTKRWIV